MATLTVWKIDTVDGATMRFRSCKSCNESNSSRSWMAPW